MKFSVAIITLLIVTTAVYGLIRSENIILGPSIKVLEVKNQEGTNAVFNVVGEVSNSNFLSINDRQIFPDELGRFESLIVLPKGYNIIELYARDKRNNQKLINIEINTKNYDNN